MSTMEIFKEAILLLVASLILFVMSAAIFVIGGGVFAKFMFAISVAGICIALAVSAACVVKNMFD